MFLKLRTSRYMKATGREDSALVEFTGNVQPIAPVHQFGLKDRPNPRSHDVQYARHQLMGFSLDEELLVEVLFMKHLMRDSY